MRDRANDPDMVPTHADRHQDRADGSDPSPTNGGYPLLDVKVS